IPFSPASLSSDEQVKQQVATKQLSELLERVANGATYRTLTKEDRALLESEGFASDLVNNIVFITQRIPAKNTLNPRLGTEPTDEKVKGYTFAAIDPSIYSSASIYSHFEQLSNGKCCFCESSTLSTDGSEMYHFRPPSIIFNNGLTIRSPYYSLAYQQDNLIYACHACAEKNKSDLFPVAGRQFPACSIHEEQALLINPYQEDPRSHIRFNPMNANAFDFKKLSDFYQSEKGLNQQELEKLIGESPQLIPLQFNLYGDKISDANNDQLYSDWESKIQHQYKGENSIRIYGLNRAPLVEERFKHLRLAFSFIEAAITNDSDDSKALAESFTTSASEYASMMVDAINSWQLGNQKNKEKTSDATKSPTEGNNIEEPTKINWQEYYSNSLSHPSKKMSTNKAQSATQLNTEKPAKTPAPSIPSWLTSVLIYVIFESELSVENKRRIVYLNERDQLYGGEIGEKCVFESIDWHKDVNNIIKVRSGKNLWETSFAELAASRPLEIIDLFANNEVWVEGEYPALVEQSAE
ncbi:MAG: hypothetical protein OQK04_11070, partial [Kangiellaceae bacterium]|nr:hypothetical protein [Kangiellaceae bacterium]